VVRGAFADSIIDVRRGYPALGMTLGTAAVRISLPDFERLSLRR
jgi:hypothetical protein